MSAGIGARVRGGQNRNQVSVPRCIGPCRDGGGAPRHAGLVQVRRLLLHVAAQVKIESNSWKQLIMSNEQTGALAPSLDFGCTIRTADNSRVQTSQAPSTGVNFRCPIDARAEYRRSNTALNWINVHRPTLMTASTLMICA